MLSIWERNSFIHHQYIIIGGGIVGLCTAYFLKQKYSKASVLVLERGLLPSGASTKNAGFACMGSFTELLDDLQKMPEEEVLSLFLLRKKGLERLQQILGKEKIGYRNNGSYELITSAELPALDKMDYWNGLLSEGLGGATAFRICNEKIADFGFDADRVKVMIENTCEGEIDTGLMMKNLVSLVLSAGIEIRTGCKVNSFEDRGHKVEVVCHDPVQKEEIVFSATKLFICNNAFAAELLPGVDVTPGRGQVLITHPVPGLKFKGIFHFDRGYYYLREYKGCVLFGGGRHKHVEEETTTELVLNETIQAELTEILSTLILPGQDFTIDMRWSGIMAFGQNRKPVIQHYSDNVIAGVRMGGMGIALGAEVGWRLSQM